jgi:hypothetical protein
LPSDSPTDVLAKQNAKREPSLIMRQMVSLGPLEARQKPGFFPDGLGAARKGPMLDFNQGAMGPGMV